MRSLLTTLALLALAQPVCARSQGEALALWLAPRLEKQLERETGLSSLGSTVSAKTGAGYIDLSVPDYIERSTVLTVRVHLGKVVRLTGRVLDKDESTLVEEACRAVLKADVRNELQAFPYGGQPAYAIFVPPVSNLGAKLGDASVENLATQARSGELVWVLERSPDGRELRVREDSDGYIAWARAADLRLLDAGEYRRLSSAPKAILKNDVKPLVAGTRLPFSSQGLESAAGGTIQVPAAALGPRPGTVEEILKTAQEFLPGHIHAAGAYLWGGNAAERFDCSGFVQTVFRLCGYRLPRDADQQLAFCKPVATTLDKISELQPGDLVFFSEKREYPDHMGIYLGEGRVIHCSHHGDYSGCKVSSLLGTTPYEKELQKEYFGGGRPPFPMK